jgi:methionine sulfoxide reductase heme-binding subunit
VLARLSAFPECALVRRRVNPPPAATPTLAFFLHLLGPEIMRWSIHGIGVSTLRMRRRLITHHLVIMLASAALVTLIYALLDSPQIAFRMSMSTAYASLVLIVMTLLLGPWRAWRGAGAPIGNDDLRRDVGIWAGLLGLIHTGFGLQVHLGSMLLYFVRPVGPERILVPRFDAMGLTNYAGLVAALILVLLLALSNDWSLRRLGLKRWKRWQRTNWLGFVLVALHGVIYQWLEKRSMPYPLIFGGLLLLVVLGRVAVARGHALRG